MRSRRRGSIANSGSGGKQRARLTSCTSKIGVCLGAGGRGGVRG